ncbi:MAG: hypothetical protein ACYTXE_43645 [Nostoc sp.]
MGSGKLAIAIWRRGDVPDATNTQSLADDLGAIALVRSGEWGVGSGKLAIAHRRRGNLLYPLRRLEQQDEEFSQYVRSTSCYYNQSTNQLCTYSIITGTISNN